MGGSMKKKRKNGKPPTLKATLSRMTDLSHRKARMEANPSRFLIGLSVQISRSDGRVHSATVKSTDAAKSTAMVEWYERNVCRGKEIEISEICALNPDLVYKVSTANKEAAEPPTAAIEKKYERQLRSSRIPAPPSFATRSQARQTCLFQPPTPGLAPSTTVRSSSAHPEMSYPDLKPQPHLKRL
ncbi:Kinesin-like protein KIF2C [Oryzias melastigma]|uniref:Kinesin-like protein KIF2C n=1 Tax=Oryzias melastigma TaxID=30732 RepID=A0A834CBF7_ORYME|nr:Kinesin-like protein KIF2C [Oryzias melastigma]